MSGKPVAGRFVLVEVPVGAAEADWGYITSWDTWPECEVAFPLDKDCRLIDGETGRTWYHGARYDWEEAST